MDEFEKLRKIALPFPLKAGNYSDTHSVEKIKRETNLNTESNCDVQKSTGYQQNVNNSEFIAFSDSILSLDDYKLNNILGDIDQSHKIDVNNPETDEVVTAVETLVNGILQAAGEIDQRFKTTCVYSGSFYDDLKVGSADEFDFVARIDSLSKKGVFEARRSERKPGFVYLVVKDIDVKYQFKELLTAQDNDPCLQDHDEILCVNAFQDYFIELLFSAIKSIDIPGIFLPVENIKHAEVSEDSWRPNRHGPCATLYLTYICQTTSNVVNIDIDIAPSIAYPGQDYEPPVLEKLTCIKPNNAFLDLVKEISFASEILLVPFHFDYTEPTSDKTWHYHYSDTWRVSHSSLEKAIFSLYSPDSVEKKLCRILKILKEIYLQGTLDTEQRANSRPLKLQEPPSTRLSCVTVEEVSEAVEEYEYETDTESDYTEDNESNEEDSQSEDASDFYNDENELLDTNEDLNQSSDTKPPFTETENRDCKPSAKLFMGLDEEASISNSSPSFEIIYVRQPRVQLQQEIEASSFKTGKNKQFEKEQEPCQSQQVDHDCLKPESLKDSDLSNKYTTEDSNSLDDIETFDMHVKKPGASELDDDTFSIATKPNFADRGIQDENQRKAIAYRDSKPLVKTYFIKMLFLAMKTAYPDPESWEPDKLSFLLKMALCMIYHAHRSKEKGILNFWFQDLIENRTRESTCVEVLYCLEHLVKTFSKKIIEYKE